MKKFLTAVILTAAVLLCGCGESKTGGDKTALTAKEVFDIVSAEGLCPSADVRAELGSEGFDNACPKLFGIEPSALTDGGIMYVGAGTSADEIAVLGGNGDFRTVLEAHAQSRANDFKGYAPDESDKAKNALIFTEDGLTILVIADNAEEIKDRLTN